MGKRKSVDIKHFHVEDWSMAPTYIPGDCIDVDAQTHSYRVPSPGDIVVVKDPEMRGRKLLKRVQKVVHVSGRTMVFVSGDNELRSRDSRQFGPIPADEIVGRVLDAETKQRKRRI
jgi:phage repressor protein C with HTH and peptisase S24 domain